MTIRSPKDNEKETSYNAIFFNFANVFNPLERNYQRWYSREGVTHKLML